KKNQEVIVTDHEFCDDSGRVWLSAEGFTIKRVPSPEALGIPSSPESTVLSGVVPASNLRKQIEQYVTAKISELLKEPNARLVPDRNFMELGADSSSLIAIVQQVEKEIGIELYPTLFFEYQNIKELSTYLYAEHHEKFSSYLGEVNRAIANPEV